MVNKKTDDNNGIDMNLIPEPYRDSSEDLLKEMRLGNLQARRQREMVLEAIKSLYEQSKESRASDIQHYIYKNNNIVLKMSELRRAITALRNKGNILRPGEDGCERGVYLPRVEG